MTGCAKNGTVMEGSGLHPGFGYPLFKTWFELGKLIMFNLIMKIVSLLMKWWILTVTKVLKPQQCNLHWY